MIAIIGFEFLAHMNINPSRLDDTGSTMRMAVFASSARRRRRSAKRPGAG
eukprot:CAMPEP_0170435792 /NCGR_PEP_ID=MMETSP0117_2-20130122/43793_1 /TAXON_ID=400756 /ORGANISM="Durinskia baltica, Strain CSIRO CS-38" /LENGTH=49 /DNA_ID= /DNA_START= /DNA_END= /DNA_ORIENTATION=